MCPLLISEAAEEGGPHLFHQHSDIVFGIAGELAAMKSNGPGSFKERFYDEAFNLSSENIKEMIKIDEI